MNFIVCLITLVADISVKLAIGMWRKSEDSGIKGVGRAELQSVEMIVGLILFGKEGWAVWSSRLKMMCEGVRDGERRKWGK